MSKRFTPILLLFVLLASAKIHSFDFVILKYKGGDYYNARDSVANFLSELRKRTKIDIKPKAVELSLDEDAVFQHYFLFLNGHIPLSFSEKERAALRKFVLNGGFVFANDDYGMDESFRKEMKLVFPEYPLQEISFDDPVYHCFYQFKNGLPKIHEHYEGAPKAYGIFVNKRIALFYDYNSDIADGWDFPEVHNDTADKREDAFRMGVNIVIYSLSH